MAKKSGRRAGLFIGGVLFGRIRGIFSRNKYRGDVVNIESVWNNIRHYEGETFKTVRGVEYQYAVYNDYILINDDKKRKITKDGVKKALSIVNPHSLQNSKSRHMGAFLHIRYNRR